MLSCGILCGGKSRRMGTNKAFLEHDHKPFLAILIDELKSCKELLLSVDSKELYCGFSCTLVEDIRKNSGPIEGVRRLLTVSTNRYLFICAVDMPFVKTEFIRYLATQISEDYDCIITRGSDGIHPLCGIYSKDILPTVEEMSLKGIYKLRFLLNQVRTKYVDIEESGFSKRILLNINTKEDYQCLLQEEAAESSSFSALKPESQSFS